MANHKVSLRYATSLLILAEEKNMLGIISADIELVVRTLEKART